MNEKPNEKNKIQTKKKKRKSSIKQEENQLDKLITKLQHTQLTVNPCEFYGNSIPLGSFCFSISFILYGLYECKIHATEDKILYTTILLFGGIGQITAGIFEYIKMRTIICTIYLMYGLYFLSFFFANYYKSIVFNDDCKKVYFATWAFLTFPICIITYKTNFFYCIQNLTITAFCVIKCIGIASDKKEFRDIIPGILELVSGFVSLYICFGQLLNEHYRFKLFPSSPFFKDNEIDYEYRKNNITN